MGWSILPKPGAAPGPCKAECRHRDCVQIRKESAGLCRHCSKPIGYGVPYYVDDRQSAERMPYQPRRLVHAACAQREAEKGGRS